VEIIRRKLALVEQQGDPYNLAHAQFQLGFGLLWSGDPSAARSWLAKGSEAFGRMGVRLWQVRCLTYEGIVSRKLGDLESVQDQAQQMLELAIAINEYTYQGIAYANQGWLAWKHGEFAKAEQLCLYANEIWKKFGRNVFHGLADWVLLAIAISQQDLQRVEGSLQALLDADPNLQPIEEPMAGLLSQALSACQGNDPGAVFALCDLALEQAQAHREL
jgi:tetratricopeptide (TPR) repeat protein